MQLEEKHVAEFQALYEARFGTHISTEEALDKGLRLVRLVEIARRPARELPPVAKHLATAVPLETAYQITATNHDQQQ
jgi:hypothetical protein